MTDPRNPTLEWTQAERYDGLPPQRVHFGVGDGRDVIAAEWQARGRPRTLVVGTNAARMAGLAAGIEGARHWAEAQMHVPRDKAEQLLAVATEERAELVVAIGGGSAIGFAKWLAVTLPVTVIAVPTTLAGSESTSAWSVTTDGRKEVTSAPRALPEVVVYDAEVLTGLPADQLVASCLNALAHAVDSLWAPRSDAATVAAALAAAVDLRLAVHGIADRDPLSLSRLQQGAYEAASVFSAAGSGLHHKICHVLGGSYGLPHAATHAALLPHVAAWLAAADPARGALLATALGGSGVVEGFAALRAALGPTPTLAELGLRRAAIADVARAVMAELPAGLPRPVTAADVEALIDAAWTGGRPVPDGGGGVSPDQDAVEEDMLERVLRSFEGTPDPRLRQLMLSLVRHLHAFIRDVRLTEAEWEATIAFLTDAGHITDDRRQEFVLLSDILGATMQTIAVNNEAYLDATQATIFGPFFSTAAPQIELGGDIAFGAPGEPSWVEGRVRSTDGSPVAGAHVDVWEADDDGLYDVQREDGDPTGRGWFLTDENGEYRFWGLTPTPYPIPHDGPVGALLAATGRSPMRAAHLHFMVTADGFRTLVTHAFIEGDEYLDSDSVFGVKDSLIMPFERFAPGTPTPDGREVSGTWTRTRFDMVLAPGPAERTRR